MAIGNVPTVAQLNSQAATIALAYRDNAAKAAALQAYAVAQGSTGLIAMGMTSGDATSFLTMCGYMASLAQVYNGTLQQGGTGGTGASLFNFGNALTALTGPY